MIENGIETQMSIPDTAQQNGRVERFQQTIINGAEAMQHHAGLSNGFWIYAVKAKLHAYNVTPIKRADYKTPTELWSGIKPNISHLRVFGCQAWVHTLKKRRSKLEPKSQAMIFIGYEPGSKGYQFWDAAHQRIEISRDVKFNETLFPAQESKKIRASLNDLPISESDSESDQSGLELVIPAQPPPWPPSPGQSTPKKQTHLNPPIALPAVPQGAQPSGSGQIPAIPEPPIPRYSLRQTKEHLAHQPQLSTENINTTLANMFQEVPNSYREAMNLEDSDKWLATSQKEFDGLAEMGVWKLVDHPSNRKTIKCRWTYVLKADGRYKARLVAKGYTQVQGIDYEETFSPVARYESIRYLLAHVALLDWEIEAMDVKLAYLHGVLDEEIYMEQPEGFIAKGEENKVCRLVRSLYGLKQAGRVWNRTFVHTIKKKLGFNTIHSDVGVYILHCHHKRGDSNMDMILILYVDNLLLLGEDLSKIEDIKCQLGKLYQMEDLGPASSYLGIQITRDRNTHAIWINQ